ncbi:hypothetical protein DWQ65_03160 [Treponema phagedenis]|uniref:Uncharacterized protein n=1 Tax=Treponema phagedenis TaxID=162 RepID=A0A0B7GU67_TREPH|nr:hypothetical protein [Treponema phagedenis]NVP22832.1 hypothetical protein [Treponema phagedenis]NVP24930.1 hypothetical protein [Treponema phagedenis]NVP25323.1 hypothetical protein [Treponema phagedenis]NVP25423.1 hypothetical protein [Treponema phagedenis]NVP25588.1 hypothetical protein [Treponema phagedenis]
MPCNFLKIIKSYAGLLSEQTKTPVIIAPSEVKSEKFHVELTLLPHPALIGNGRARFRMRGTVFAEIPASEPAINDCLSRSLALAQFFDDTQGFTIQNKTNEQKGIYGLAYHRPLRDDDDLFSDLESEERSYSYNESWLIELEFNLDEVM